MARSSISVASPKSFRSCFGERIRRKPLQHVARDQPAMNVSHARFNVADELKPRSALAHIDGANLPGPVIDVLEQMAVDGPQMCEVEFAFGNALCSALS